MMARAACPPAHQHSAPEDEAAVAADEIAGPAPGGPLGDRGSDHSVQHGERPLRRLTGLAVTTYRGCGHDPQRDAAETCARDLSELLRDPARLRARVRGASGAASDDGNLDARLAPSESTPRW
jgi:hypothetical protein